MSPTTSTTTPTSPAGPFRPTSDSQILSKEEIMELHQSRFTMLVFFDCIEAIGIPSVSDPNSFIPREVALSLYGTNDAVTLLATTSGSLRVLDGRKCYSIWREAVRTKQLPETVVLNVIMAPRTLSSLQMLQLATVCNIRSRPSKMTSLFEKINITQAFFEAFTASTAINESLDRAAMDSETCEAICTKVSEALYNASLFDVYLRQPVKIFNDVEDFILGTVGTCLALKEEHELMAFIKRLFATSHSLAEGYFDTQFFLDYRSPWFSSAPLLKQMLLLFVLPLLPAMSKSSDSAEHIAERKLRALVRELIPRICDEICCSITTHVFQEVKDNNSSSPYPELLYSGENELLGDDTVWVLHSIACQAVFSIQRIERHILSGMKCAGSDEIIRTVIRESKKHIHKYVSKAPLFSIDHLLK